MPDLERALSTEHAMAWGPIVVGVDASAAAVQAAALAERIAKLAAVPFELVHAVRDAWAPLVAVNPDPQVAEMQLLQQVVARERVSEVLRGTVSDRVLETLKVRFGPAAVVLRQVVEERRPGLLVLGGKHHTALERWLGGSTSLHVVRTSEVPVLITAREPATPRRVLVAADLSQAAGPTVRLAERFARLVGAQLRMLTVYEPLPDLPGIPPMDPTEYYALAQETLERDVWPLVKTPNVEKLVRHGMVVDTLLREASEWQADVLVVGSHGKGWAQRVLLGSVTERLINHLPTSLLVAPVGVAAAALSERRQRQLAIH
jgi:nucleotide-binding universal stress UspA family protein